MKLSIVLVLGLPRVFAFTPNHGVSSLYPPPSLFRHNDLLSSIEAVLPSSSTTPSTIFCNRELNFDQIKSIGFDMDYTLAQYKSPAFDLLAYEGAIEKLITRLNYPASLRSSKQFDESLWSRGLIIDTRRGNFLKIDRHKYVRVAQHGFNKMTSENRKATYSRTFNVTPFFSESYYKDVDTLFQIVDCHLFAACVDLKDEIGEDDDDETCSTLDEKTYEEIYKDVRAAVDLCHRDGVIKDEVAKNPSKYIVKEEKMVEMLRRFKDDGLKTFLLTNSLWDYTQTVMRYLTEDEGDDDAWADLFDVIICGSCKPKFLVDPRLDLMRVIPTSGHLINTDGVYEIEKKLGGVGATEFLRRGKIFQGGNWLHLQSMLECDAGEQILYVGDHLFSDVVRSKRTLGWRTALIVPELDSEMKIYESTRKIEQQIFRVRGLRATIALEADQCRDRAFLSASSTHSHQQNNCEELVRDDSHEEIDSDCSIGCSNKIRELNEYDVQLKNVLSELAEVHHQAFNPTWGMLFRSGYQSSRFATQIEAYACIYTSKASNFWHVSKNRAFRTNPEYLAHEKQLQNNPFEAEAETEE